MREGRRDRTSLLPLFVVLLLGAATLGLLVFFVGLGRLREWLEAAEEKLASGLLVQEALEPEKTAAVEEAVRQAGGETVLGPRSDD